MDVPDVLDLEHLRGKGQQEGEEAMPQDDDEDKSRSDSRPSFVFNQGMLQSLTDMGFSIDAAKRAIYNTQTSGSIDQATNWLFAHIGDPDLNDPFTVPTQNVFATGNAGGPANRPGVDISAYTDNPNFVIDNEALQNLLGMGMNEEQSRLALHFTVSL